MAVRVGLIHSTRHSIAPIERSFGALWPEADLANLLDETLLKDRRAAGQLTPALHARIASLARHSASAGARSILFCCSAFGPAIEAARAELHIPVLRPYEAMIEAGLDAGPRIAVLATFEPTIDEIAHEVEKAAHRRRMKLALATRLSEGALAALEAGRAEEHDAIVARDAGEFRDCDAVLLAQFSMAGAKRLMRDQAGRRVFTSPDCAVERLRRLVGR